MNKVARSILKGLKEAIAYEKGELPEGTYRVHIPRLSTSRQSGPSWG